ncbi:bifunctional biotin--[acetyl-CoA-carboxylase] ligase/biotin operon repressor BirA [Streptococcus ratti]|uniref:Bifunctional ligase/repressor BirA n=1 Tax=Streptococcus ratti FA-1 = DSM 20564 TaxID=699248 RepID=A0ABN0GV98_STRRT|nr:bifunctional biotin--[acetyl-CoA-carboxylase] ligase/biotin operon repressor BirA [Streptococcus ratti]EJN94264.1 biotin--protein ligase [Streptococcus ratti FA-1 = DSM 20564]EMP70909.1 bifunctional biotin--[acetyl-CoA-carboxylase] synthetase/biotin operon repressor [Streptococcus ratti FA-1 = DSM 20564]QEY06218.1 bifunctional biotin--[acetyl-CoA-carboxylase] synthetase/biotin operon repressor [Streptococcus ratti]VEI60558.1 bifunctional biotin--[acetyl-CoA-carboxylase] synthetase/biotin ope
MKTYEKIYQVLAQTDNFVTGEVLGKELSISRTAVWKAIQTLEGKGLVIESVKNRGYRLLSGDLFLPDEIEKATGLKIFFNEKSSSTQLDAKAGIEKGDPSPALYLAPSQKAARGRFSRQFFAPEAGGIYMSLHLHPELPFKQLPSYTLMAATSVVKAISRLTGIETDIKWVNDIYLDGKKVAGILTEAVSSIETGLITDVIIGMGINFHVTDFPEELQSKAASIFSEKPTITRNQLISEIWNIFFNIPKEDLIKVYKEKSLVLDRQVTFVENDITYKGIATDISDTGQLIVQLEDGQEKVLNSGEISLSSW